MVFNLCFYHQLWVKWVCIHIGNSYGHIGLEIVMDILDKVIHDSQNICGFLTRNEMHIKFTSLSICLINDNLTNTSSASPSEGEK